MGGQGSDPVRTACPPSREFHSARAHHVDRCQKLSVGAGSAEPSRGEYVARKLSSRIEEGSPRMKETGTGDPMEQAGAPKGKDQATDLDNHAAAHSAGVRVEDAGETMVPIATTEDTPMP